MIGIKDIASYVPPGFVDNLQQARDFGEQEAFVTTKIGSTRLPRKSDGEETSDMVCAAVEALLARNPTFKREHIGALVVVTQNGDGEGLPHTSAIAQSKLGLPAKVAAFDVSLGCSGYVYGLYILKGFLEAAGLSDGVLVTADPYSKVVDPKDRITALLFGDAATATWLGKDAEWQLGHVRFGTEGAGADYLKVEHSRLHMNGRQILNFAALNVAPEISALLSACSLKPDDVDAYCVHQGSMAIIDALSRRFPDVAQRFLRGMEGFGNTVSSSIPLLLERCLRDPALNRILLCGFGVGLSWGSAIILRTGES